MGSIKKAKKPKDVKLPKKAITEKPTKEEKRIKKQIIKENKQLNKKIERRLGMFAIFLCMLSSILDVVTRIKHDNINNQNKI